MNIYKVMRTIKRSVVLPRPIAAIAVLACTAFLFGALSRPAFGQAVGLVGGVARDATSGKPLANTRIIAHNLADGADQATVSDASGMFAFTNLGPGQYQIAATKDGFQKSWAIVQVTAGQTARVELPLRVAGDMRQTAESLSQATERSNDTQLSAREVQLLDRIERLERRLAAMEARDPNATQAAEKSSLRSGPMLASLSPVAVPIPAVTMPPPPVPTPTPQSAKESAPAAPSTPPAPTVPEALQAPPATTGVDNFTPFAFGDFTWLNGTPRNKDTVLDTKYFTPEVRFDTHYMQDFNQPVDHTIVGATESFRAGEIQIEQASVGGDFHWQNVRGRILFMQGLFSTTTPRNDGSSATGSYPGNTGGIGQWDLQNAYKYVSEAYGGYHFNVNHGLNVDAGIFVSYIGLFSYYNFDNWTYQPSYVSSNTPWFFNGVRVQWYPTAKLKIEPWFINGWQSYAKFNSNPGLGGQLLWMPKEWFKLVANQYGHGQDNLGIRAERLHTDDSIEVRYYNKPESLGLSKVAFSLTADAGMQTGGGLCGFCAPSKGKNSFVGWMAYDRYWFHKDQFAITLGGGEMSNWGRYLTLLPPIDGAWASSGSVYFPQLPGQRAHMWDSTVTFHWMPAQYITWWGEVGYRHSDIPYFAGRGGVTPPGGNNGAPQYYTCNTGASSGTNSLSAAYTACGGAGSVWFPDLRRSETKLSFGVMVKF